MRTFIAMAVSLSVVSLIVAFLGSGRSAGERGEGANRSIEEEQTRLSRDSRGLSTRVGELAGRLASLEAGARPKGPGSEPKANPLDSEGPGSLDGGPRREIEEIAKRLEDLEAKLEVVGSRANRALVAPGGSEAPETDEVRRNIVSESQAVAMDRSLSPRDRLVALRALRSRGGRSKEVTQSMIELIQDPALDPRMRADVIRNLSGVDFPELKQALLAVLQNDTDSDTRSETVETLQAFYGDPSVHAAIVQVRDHDADAEVRSEAARRLDQYENRGQRK